MGWETRRGKQYYYRKERHAGRVRSICVGSGPLAEWVADVEEEERLHLLALDEELRHRMTLQTTPASGPRRAFCSQHP